MSEPMNPDGLLALYTYNAYANDIVLETAAHLAEDELTRQSSPSHGSVHALLVHMLECEAFFLSCCQGQPPAGCDRAGLSGVAGIRRCWSSLAQTQREFITALDENDLRREILLPFGEGQPHLSLWQLLVQAFVHSTHHRGELSIVLSGLGRPLPTLDIILHFFAQSGQEWPG
jgi:uncharacterized damage-inducible protein DinB